MCYIVNIVIMLNGKLQLSYVTVTLCLLNHAKVSLYQTILVSFIFIIGIFKIYFIFKIIS